MSQIIPEGRRVALFPGDCLESLRKMPDCSVDSVVTDPPYGLAFMGKRWDYDVPSVEIWAECLRVLKPGGHLLAFAGTRTQHRMAVRIEDAGFEIRDMIAWVYGSGFPKSLDVSKAIDKQRTEDIEPLRAICRVIRAAMDAEGLKSRHLVKHFDGCHPRLIDHWAARDTDSQPALPTWEQWQKLRDVLCIDAEHDAEVWRLNGRKGQPGDTWQAAEVIGKHAGVTPGFGERRFSVRDTNIRAASETATAWQGWGTALKPALEPITVARKPLIGTVAANVLAHGTGALNIDGCRIGDDVVGWGGAKGGSEDSTQSKGRNYRMGEGEPRPVAGRWPANLILQDCDEVVGVFPVTTSGGDQKPGTPRTKANTYGDPTVSESAAYGSNTGSAARFFYCAKASKRDREEGLDGFAPAKTNDGRKVDADNAYQRRATLRTNTHPTVKPTDLMRYLCRLVTPPGGVVLDPFMGSGSTGKAAMLEGFKFIGCELSPEYLEIAKARIRHAMQQSEQDAPANDNARPGHEAATA